MNTKTLAIALMLFASASGFAKTKTEDPEITKLKSKIEDVMKKTDAQPDWL